MSIEKWFNCYGQRGDLFIPETSIHPAKMAVPLCYRILKHGELRGYWKPGDWVLDPMCGVGTTLICASSWGYNVVGIELESHFYEPCLDNLFEADQKGALKGQVRVLQGDSRFLSKILQCMDAALASPPYGDQQVTASGHFRSQREPNAAEAAKGHHLDGYDAAISSPPYLDTLGNPSGIDADKEKKVSGRHAQHKIAQSYDAVLSSPPYADQGLPAGIRAEIRNLAREGKWEEAISKLRECEELQVERGQKFGVSSEKVLRRKIEFALACEQGYSGVVTSPPYGETHVGNPGEMALVSEGRAKEIGTKVTGHGGKGRHGFQYSHDEKAQIGNLRDPKGDIDAVLSSPPWEKGARGGQQGWSDPDKAAKIAAERYASGERKGHPASAEAIKKQMERDEKKGYGNSKGQIGQTKGETYLSAMLQVYREMWKVLKPRGVVCLVTKNPVKNKQIRRLDLDTIKLMEKAGFTFLERQMAMLAEETHLPGLFEDPVVIRKERKSFFKRLFEKEYPHLMVDHEDVSWFRK